MVLGELTPEQAVAQLEAIEDPWELLRAATDLAPGRTALGTSGQITGTAVIEGSRQHDIPIRVYTVDTRRLFPETYEYFETLEAHYGVEVERYRPDPEAVGRMIRRHGEYLFFDSKAKQEYCCELRKVSPNNRALATVDIWISGLRRDQSEARQETPRIQVATVPDPEGGTRDVIKVAPLVDWTEGATRDFLERHGAPIHPLLTEQEGPWFYESLGCVICTTPQARWEPRRAGRWRWFNEEGENAKECGLHLHTGKGHGI